MQIKNVIISLFLLSLSTISGAWACDSYEDCMSPKITECKEYIGYQKDLASGEIHHNYISKLCEEPNYLKAIAFKLVDIDKTNQDMGKTLDNINKLMEKLKRA